MATVNIILTAEQGGPKTITLSQSQLDLIDKQRAAGGTGGSTPSTPPAANGPKSYPIQALTENDKRWLVQSAMYRYRIDTNAAPHVRTDGSKWTGNQLLEDVLVDGRGKNVWELGGPQGGGMAMQNQINAIKQEFSAGGAGFQPGYKADTYQGPLRSVYGGAVAAKLKGE